MAQLVERSLPTPEILGSNPVIDKINEPFVQLNYRKAKNKEKESGSGPFKKSLAKISNEL